jgi:hypothetical protein
MMLNTRPGVGNGKMDKVEKFEGVYIFKRTWHLNYQVL